MALTQKFADQITTLITGCKQFRATDLSVTFLHVSRGFTALVADQLWQCIFRSVLQSPAHHISTWTSWFTPCITFNLIALQIQIEMHLLRDSGCAQLGALRSNKYRFTDCISQKHWYESICKTSAWIENDIGRENIKLNLVVGTIQRCTVLC